MIPLYSPNDLQTGIRTVAMRILSPVLKPCLVTGKPRMILPTMESPIPSVLALCVGCEERPASPSNSSQAFFRRTNIATKLKITYLRDGLLDVRFHSHVQHSQLTALAIRSKSITKLVSPQFLTTRKVSDACVNQGMIGHRASR